MFKALNYRIATAQDIPALIRLGLKAWSEFKGKLTASDWKQLEASLTNSETYSTLLDKGSCIVCEDENSTPVGMAFFVPSGEATDIYDQTWSQLRFVSVDPDYRGLKIGEQLTYKCMALAKANGESIMALHTSELMPAAKFIYEKLGFEINREIPPRYHHKYWLYTLKLN